MGQACGKVCNFAAGRPEHVDNGVMMVENPTRTSRASLGSKPDALRSRQLSVQNEKAAEATQAQVSSMKTEAEATHDLQRRISESQATLQELSNGAGAAVVGSETPPAPALNGKDVGADADTERRKSERKSVRIQRASVEEQMRLAEEALETGGDVVNEQQQPQVVPQQPVEDKAEDSDNDVEAVARRRRSTVCTEYWEDESAPQAGAVDWDEDEKASRAARDKEVARTFNAQMHKKAAEQTTANQDASTASKSRKKSARFADDVEEPAPRISKVSRSRASRVSVASSARSSIMSTATEVWQDDTACKANLEEDEEELELAQAARAARDMEVQRTFAACQKAKAAGQAAQVAEAEKALEAAKEECEVAKVWEDKARQSVLQARAEQQAEAVAAAQADSDTDDDQDDFDAMPTMGSTFTSKTEVWQDDSAPRKGALTAEEEREQAARRLRDADVEQQFKKGQGHNSKKTGEHKDKAEAAMKEKLEMRRQLVEDMPAAEAARVSVASTMGPTMSSAITSKTEYWQDDDAARKGATNAATAAKEKEAKRIRDAEVERAFQANQAAKAESKTQEAAAAVASQDLNALSKEELKNQLRAEGQKVHGNKAELIRRLSQSSENKARNSTTSSAGPPASEGAGPSFTTATTAKTGEWQDMPGGVVWVFDSAPRPAVANALAEQREKALAEQREKAAKAMRDAEVEKVFQARKAAEEEQQQAGAIHDDAKQTNPAQEGPAVVVLISSETSAENLENIEKLRNILDERRLRYDELDGNEAKNRVKRNKLFEISKRRGQYPQVFMRDSAGVFTFVGGFGEIEHMVEVSGLVKEQPDLIQRRPSLLTFERVFASLL